ncbi:MAG: hypothetical protein NTW87_07570 [Planctomycetota bacterium]|nr:hypothetical protein [Planctomycetota bacterium]
MTETKRTDGQAERRQQWFQAVREHLGRMLNPDGSGTMPQFNPPYREPIWILPALYSGSQEHIDLANRIVSRYNDAPSAARKHEAGAFSGADFNIFQSNDLAFLLHHYGHLATPKAREVMEWHARLVFGLHIGSRQSDFKFHGANDNMPMAATLGHIMGGEALGDRAAVEHGVWMLNQFRRLLSRSAWASEFNSLTYSAVTLSAAAKIAAYAHDADIRQLALEIEQRLWAEVILHYHPATRQFAGPQSRVYMVDLAGHVHSLHMLFWLAFGPEASGREPIQSYFQPDGKEVIHFEGNYCQSIAEYCSFLEAEVHVPDALVPLVTARKYPAVLRGRTEVMNSPGGPATELLTTTYMEENFSLGTVSRPWLIHTTAALMATYKRCSKVRSFRDGGLLHVKYLSGPLTLGAKERSTDGAYEGEMQMGGPGWFYTLQKDNVALLSATPAPDELANKPTGCLRLAIIFPAHFGKISRSIIGQGQVRGGAVGESAEPEGVSVEAGEVFIHLRPLLPTLLPRQAAVRFVTSNAYEVLELVNYEGPRRCFTRAELSRMLNGAVLTLQAKSKNSSLEDFHQRMSRNVTQDYLSSGRRFLLFQRHDVEFELVYTTDPLGVQTETIDGRHRPRPVFESNQIEVGKLPFVNGPVRRATPHFPWGRELRIVPYPNAWLVGSRGLPGEEPYSDRFEGSDAGADAGR